MSESAKMVTDGVLGSLGILAFFIQGLTALTAVGGLLLISLRIAIAVQEYRINRVKLSLPGAVSTSENVGEL